MKKIFARRIPKHVSVTPLKIWVYAHATPESLFLPKCQNFEMEFCKNDFWGV
jgi:hypothetical protein